MESCLKHHFLFFHLFLFFIEENGELPMVDLATATDHLPPL